MAITGPVSVDAYNMISSLADNYLKNRDTQQQYRQREEQIGAQQRLADQMRGYGAMGNMGADALRAGDPNLAQYFFSRIPQQMMQRSGQNTGQNPMGSMTRMAPQSAPLPPERPQSLPMPVQTMGYGDFGVPQQNPSAANPHVQFYSADNGHFFPFGNGWR